MYSSLRYFWWLILTLPMPVWADDWLARDHLLGEWEGQRPSLVEKGIAFNFLLTTDHFAVTHGGVNTGSETFYNADLTATLDANKLWGWNDITLFFYLLGDGGGDINEHVGSLQGIDNIEAPDAWKLYEAWIDKRFNEHRSSVRFGLYNLNSEFDVSQSASLFINPSLGIGKEYSQAGLNGPSIFPTTSVSLRFLHEFSEQTYFQIAALDGVPGDRNTAHGTHIHFDPNDGFLYAAELGHIVTLNDVRQHKIALGLWHYTETFDDLVDTDSSGQPIKRHNNQGAYALGEWRLISAANNPALGLNVFGRYGIANADINPVSHFLEIGITYTGAFTGRASNQLGLAVVSAYSGEKYRQVLQNAGITPTTSETIIEFTFSMQLTPWLVLQPDLQRVIHPGMDSAVTDATVIGLRTKVTF